MSESTQFEKGDVVIHTRRPEWGVGVVDHAAVVMHEGKTAQRLTIRFANHGRVAVNTAVAAIKMKDSKKAMASTNSSIMSTSTNGAGWLDSIDGNKQSEKRELWSLPDSMTDPFASLSARLKATLDSCRFSKEPRSLIDWAVAQSGLTDPLSEYNRHQLEQSFSHFVRDRDRHLGELVRTVKKKGDREVLGQVMQDLTIPAAQRALEAAIRA